MTNLTIQAQTVQVPNQTLNIPTYVAVPTGAAKFPIVVVLQEVFGVNAHIRDVTERIAREGYVAIAPALFQRTAPNFETGYTPENLQLGRHYKDQTQATELLSDIQAAISYAQGLPQANPKAVGCIGFCFGGHVAFLAATLPDIQATAAFYGAGIATFTPGGGAPTLSRTPEIQGTLYAFFGNADPSIPPEQIDQIEAELKHHQVPHQVFRYEGAEHGFFCDRRANYHPEAAAAAWEQVKQLFASTLQAQ
ncbi:MAG: dienelactone hydrolase family protein [Leptolyngbyaceae bacterium]|nr:dienelactone hydrolase family protein [Leptolyngbyaceae bacterium]